MNTLPQSKGKWTERGSTPVDAPPEDAAIFQQFIERSADAILILDSQTQRIVDCNAAAVTFLRFDSREGLLSKSLAEFAPALQPDGAPSDQRASELIVRALKHGPQRIDWLGRGKYGDDFLMEVLVTPVQTGQRALLVTSLRELGQRQETEIKVRQLSLELERSMAERAVELVRANQQLRREIAERERTEALLKESEERARTLVEHAPDAIVVFDFDTGRFTDVNPNALRLYGLSREQLLTMGPADVSPAVQADGRPSAEVAREKLEAALAGETPVFDWWHRDASGRIVPCEIRLARLPAHGRRLVRGSVVDNSQRQRNQRTQRAIYQISEAIHTTDDLDSLFRQIHSIIQGLMLANNFYIALYDPVSEYFSFPYFVDEVDPPPGPRRLTTGLTSYVLKTGKTLLVNRRSPIRREGDGVAVVVEASRETPYIEVGTPSAVWLGAPLTIRGQTIGVVAVQDYHEEDAYGDEEKQILAFVAEQTAIAVERKRAEQALRKRSERISKHRDVLLELAQLDKSDLPAALERICQVSADSLDVARVSYWSLQANDTALVCDKLYVQATGRVDPSATGVRLIERDCPPYFQALAVKRPIVVSRAETDPATRGLTEGYLRPLGITSLLDAPVWLHGEVIGVVCHEHIGPPRDWTVEEVDFATSLATMASLSHEAAQRVRSEQALRESEAKFRALFEATSQGVMLHDEEQFLEVNPAAVRIMGYDRAEDIIGKHPAQTSAPVQLNGQSGETMARQYIAECVERGSVRFEWLSRTPRGEDVPLEVILTRIAMGGRQIIQAVINDITERKKAEAELLRALGREKELGELKSNFVSMVSHEFRTPLGIIMSSAEILQDYLDQLGAEERQHHLKSIAKNTRRMADLMEEVLLLGRFEAGKMDFQPAPLDLVSFARRLVEDLLSATERRCPIELDAGLCPAEAQADERLLRHIFTNLLSNAIKYSEPGHPVRFSLRPDGTDLLCVIQDKGIGIPEPDQAWLFNAFHRGRNVGHRAGTGLGLVIVKRCVELHAGRVRIESAIGVGTTVAIRLPLFSQST